MVEGLDVEESEEDGKDEEKINEEFWRKKIDS